MAVKLPPLCRYCGKPIDKETQRVWLEKQRQPGHSDGKIMRYVYPLERGMNWPTTKQECQRLLNSGTVVSIQYNADRTVRSFGVWDGESYISPFFCTGDHARLFAYSVARASTLSPREYHEAVKAQADAATQEEAANVR